MARNDKLEHLNTIFHVQERFCRSTNIKLDWQNAQFLGGYQLTPTGKTLAKRIANSVKAESSQRAWSITGPYGSGKSSFALFLAGVLCTQAPKSAETEKLRQQIGLQKQKLFPLLIVGKREKLGKSLLTKIAESVLPLSSALSKEILDLTNRDHPEAKLGVVLEKIIHISNRAGYSGVLLILDEFGKYLEYASMHPETDLFVLQELAELAARSGKQPFLFVTILHTAFSEYLYKADNVQRAEWQKIQGRFIDATFQEPAEQFLKLIGTAISRSGENTAVTKAEKELSSKLVSCPLGNLPKRMPLNELLPHCLPLDPITALLCWSVFRSKLAQNERSLFAFLSTEEPFGFQQFLRENVIVKGILPRYCLDRLYDYILNALGDAVYRGDKSKRWSEIENALNRLPANAPHLSVELIKTIGLLSLYGVPVGLRPSLDILTMAVGESQHLKIALKFLQDRSIVIYRKHEMAYALWEGSDFDLDAAYEEALRYSGAGSFAERLSQAIDLRPIVARGHYIKAGTLRYFTVQIVDSSTEAINRAISTDFYPADGNITYVLSFFHKERVEIINLVRKLSQGVKHKHLRLFAFPKLSLGLDEVLKEVEAWHWIANNNLGMNGDAVARQEVQSRLLAAKKRLREAVGKIFGIHGHVLDPNCSDWIYKNRLQPFRTAKQFLQWLSQLCDNTFHCAPIFLNELLNREHLSSASAAARRNLLQKMIDYAEQENLGINGYPPEMSMYAAMLKVGGFHRRVDAKWVFARPNGTWKPVWDYISRFLKETHKERRPISALFQALRNPPYGMKSGPLPVLLCCAILGKRENIALYEEGNFIPEVRIEVIERLLRSPEKFEIQEYITTQVSRNVLSALGELLSSMEITHSRSGPRNLLNVVKPLVVFAGKLPSYVKQTKRISSVEALAIRDSLLYAKDPHALIFYDLPKAVGISLQAQKTAEVFVSKIALGLKTLQRTYTLLLDEIESQLRSEFDLPGNAEAARKQLQYRALPLVGRTADPWLSAIIRETANLGERDWREVMGRVINKGNPVHQWQDTDVISFQLNLKQVSKDFIRLEELVSEQFKTGASEILRVGILNGTAREARAIISIPKEHADQIFDLSYKIQGLLESMDDASNQHIKIAALAKVISQFLIRDGQGDEELKEGAFL